MAAALAPVDHRFNFRFPIFCCSSKAPTTTTAYRPAVILPGLGNNSGDYHKLELTLKEDGVASVVAKVSRLDWLRNAAGLVDPNYWRGTLTPRPVLDWYLERVDEAVQEAKQLTQGCWSTLYYRWDFVNNWTVSWRMAWTCLHGRIWVIPDFVVVDSWDPHLPPPKGMPGVIDQTR